jgi:hypothetical protein
MGKVVEEERYRDASFPIFQSVYDTILSLTATHQSGVTIF